MRWTGAILSLAIGLLASVGVALGSTPTGPSDCHAKGVHSVLLSFASAFNRGDSEELDGIFAQKPDFQWYTTDGRIGKAAKQRDTLIPYFSRRHLKGERLGVASFRFTGNSRHWGNFEMTMRRSVPSRRGGDWVRVPGKGAAVCAAGSSRLIVMSFGNAPGR
ncbi:MAG TPA: hypothetical protein VFL89_00540 [Solirubrobacterales bacterium]|nr:hypothetical protein [Solirubrobacterales bacterium]